MLLFASDIMCYELLLLLVNDSLADDFAVKVNIGLGQCGHVFEFDVRHGEGSVVALGAMSRR